MHLKKKKRKKVHFKIAVTVILPCQEDVSSLPVSGQRSQSEHRHADGSELDVGDDFAARSPEQPLLCQVTAGIHRGAGHEQ